MTWFVHMAEVSLFLLVGTQRFSLGRCYMSRTITYSFFFAAASYQYFSTTLISSFLDLILYWMAQERAEITYSPVSTSEERGKIKSNEAVQKQLLYQQWVTLRQWNIEIECLSTRYRSRPCSSTMFSKSRIKLISATLVLVTIMAGSMVFFISTHRSKAANISIQNEPGKAGLTRVESSEMIDDCFSNKN